MSDRDSERIAAHGGSGEATGAYVARRLAELAQEADGVIALAASGARDAPGDLNEIYREAWWELHLRLGDGAIGPATAAAAPLLGEKQAALAARLGIADAVREEFEWSVGRTLPGVGPLANDIETSAAPVFWRQPPDESTLLDIRARLRDSGGATVELARRFPPEMTLAQFEDAVRIFAIGFEGGLAIETTGRYRVLLHAKR